MRSNDYGYRNWLLANAIIWIVFSVTGLIAVSIFAGNRTIGPVELHQRVARCYEKAGYVRIIRNGEGFVTRVECRSTDD